MDETTAESILDAVRSVKKCTSEIILYRENNFLGNGRRFVLPLTGSVEKLKDFQFDNTISSVRVVSGVWKLFEVKHFEGKSILLTPGTYTLSQLRDLEVILDPENPTESTWNVNGAIGSVRLLGN